MKTLTLSSAISELLNQISSTIKLHPKQGIEILDKKKFAAETIDILAREAALNPNADIRAAAQRIIREAFLALGGKPASIHEFYMARASGKWSNRTVPAFNIRAGTYDTMRSLLRAAKSNNVGVLIFELAKSERRYSYQDLAEYTAMAYAAAIKEGYSGLLFLQGDHYQVVAKDYFSGDSEKQKKAIQSIEKLIEEAVLAGKYNIDIDPSTLVNEKALDEIIQFEKEIVDDYLKKHPEKAQGLDDHGLKSLRRQLVDEIELGSRADYKLTPDQQKKISDLYHQMHATTLEVTQHFIRFIRALEKRLGLPKPISIGIEERHIDNPKHKDFPSTLLGSFTLAKAVSDWARQEGLVGPSKLALQTGAMHGLGGEVDFGIYDRHVKQRDKIGISIFVQHGTSTLDAKDFPKMPASGVGEAHLATEYQKLSFEVIAEKLPALAEKMAAFLEGLMSPEKIKDPQIRQKIEASKQKPEDFTKFNAMWALAFGDPSLAIAGAQEDRKAGKIKSDDDFKKQIDTFQKLAGAQKAKPRAAIIKEVLGDTLPKGLKGKLKDLVKELSGPFKDDIWNLPADAKERLYNHVLYDEFNRIMRDLNVTNTQALIESVIPLKSYPVTLPPRPTPLESAIAK